MLLKLQLKLIQQQSRSSEFLCFSDDLESQLVLLRDAVCDWEDTLNAWKKTYKLRQKKSGALTECASWMWQLDDFPCLSAARGSELVRDCISFENLRLIAHYCIKLLFIFRLL